MGQNCISCNFNIILFNKSNLCILHVAVSLLYATESYFQLPCSPNGSSSSNRCIIQKVKEKAMTWFKSSNNFFIKSCKSFAISKMIVLWVFNYERYAC